MGDCEPSATAIHGKDFPRVGQGSLVHECPIRRLPDLQHGRIIEATRGYEAAGDRMKHAVVEPRSSTVEVRDDGESRGIKHAKPATVAVTQSRALFVHGKGYPGDSGRIQIGRKSP